MKKLDKIRLAVLASHPIEYQGPLFRSVASQPDFDLTVYYCWNFGLEESYDPGFGRNIKWDLPLLEGYKSVFLKNFSPKPTSSKWWGEINPGIVLELFRNKYDAILILGWQVLTSWLAVLAAFFSGTPLLMRGENPLNQELSKNPLKLFLKQIFLRLFFKLPKAFLYIGEENRKFYKYYGVPDNKLFFAPYAVDNDRFMDEANSLKTRKEIFKKELGLKANTAIVLFMGKLIPKKRPMDLLQAFEIITRNTRISPNITNKTKIVEKELSYRLTGIFFEIHKELGRFARERQYADVLERKLKEAGIAYRREIGIEVAGRKSNIADFVVENKVLIELKQKPVNTGEDYKQIMRYLESARFELGLLVNFGLEYLKPKRILNPKLKFSNSNSANSDKFVYSDSASLVFVGDGALRSALENYVKDKNLENVFFEGFRNQTELAKYYTLADIFVLPSAAGETWGMVVNEAMCFGLPVLVSDMVGCGADLVKNGENGFIFPVGDIEKLSRAVADLIGDARKRKRFGDKSREIVRRYSFEADIAGLKTALKND